MIKLSGCTCEWSPASCAPCTDKNRQADQRAIQAMIDDFATFRSLPEDFVEPASISTLIGSPPLEPGQCCPRDFDRDGNCDRHPDPRVLERRGYVL